MTNKTLYSPRVFNNITEARIADIFENKACFGQISKIDLVTKEKYKSAYIHFANWKDNDATRAFQKEMDENGKAKVTYDVPWFWIVLEYKKKIPMSTPENSPTLRGVPAAPKKQITQKALMRGFARRNLTGDFDNITKEKDAFFFYQGGKGIYIAEPIENMRDVKNHIGASFRQLAASRYKLYLIDQAVSWTNTLYIFDEWDGYVATTRSAVESFRSGKWEASGNSDPIEGIADFMYFCSAAIVSIKNVDPNYLVNNSQFKAGYAMIMEESVRWVNEARKESIWQNSKAWAKFQNLQTAPDAAEVRAAIKELMGAAWTQRVLGF